MTNQNICVLLIVGLLVIGAYGQRGFRSACPCRDEQPDGEFTCEQQRKFGKCSEDFMINGGYCQATCDRCPIECPYEKPELDLSCGCTNEKPEGNYSCDEQRQFGSCSESWMIEGDYCEASCERCVCVNGLQCSNIPPEGDVLCIKQKEFGACEESWMEAGGFCQVSCGTCSTVEVDDVMELLPAVEPNKVSAMPNAPLKPEIVVPENFDVVSEFSAPQSLNAPEPEEETSDDNDVVDLTGGLPLSVVSLPVPEPEVELFPDCNTTLYDVATNTEGLTFLGEMIEAAGMRAIFSDKAATYTVFAPNDKAVENFAETQEVDLQELLNDNGSKRLLQTILGYHVVGAPYTAADLTELAVLETLLGEDFLLFVEVIRQRINLEAIGSSATLVTTDVEVCGSVVHIIDEVLLSEANVADIKPINLIKQLKNAEEEEEPVEVVECTEKPSSPLSTLESIPEATTFVTALEAVEFEDFPEGPLTIFVPTGEAFQNALSLLGFANLPEAVSTEANRQQLLSVLISHMVQGYFPSNLIVNDEPLATLETIPLVPEFVEDELMIGSSVNSAAVIAADVSETCDLAVHIVDAVLLPFAVEGQDTQRKRVDSENTEEAEVKECLTLADVFASRPDLEILLEVASAAGLDDVLNDSAQKITFFAPVNAAFANLTAALGDSSEAVLSNEEYLNAVLAYHALDGAFSSKDLLPGESFPTLVKSRGTDALELTVKETQPNIVVLGQGNTATVLETDLPACDSIIHIVDTVLLPVSQN